MVKEAINTIIVKKQATLKRIVGQKVGEKRAKDPKETGTNLRLKLNK